MGMVQTVTIVRKEVAVEGRRDGRRRTHDGTRLGLFLKVRRHLLLDFVLLFQGRCRGVKGAEMRGTGRRW